MFNYYFKSFEDKNFSQQITIWHQANGQNWLERRSEDSITINVDSSNIREGFFLTGFEYTKDGKNLEYATQIDGNEYFMTLTIA